MEGKDAGLGSTMSKRVKVGHQECVLRVNFPFEIELCKAAPNPKLVLDAHL